jgi:hypothetical protein
MRAALPGVERLPRRSWLLVVPTLLGLVWLLAALGLGTSLPGPLADPGRGLVGLSTVFLGIFIEAVPFLLLGVVSSAALHFFVTPRQLVRLIPRQPILASLGGALLGLIFPVCECGVVPVSRRLMQKGAPLSLGIAFLLAAPVVNPVVIFSTWAAFGGDWGMVGWRLGLTLVIAAAVGLVFAAHPRPQDVLLASPAGTGTHHYHDHGAVPGGHAADPIGRISGLVWHSGAEFIEMSRYLILGALLAALLQTFVPRTTLLALGDTPATAVLVMLALAVVLSICSTVDAFLALSFAGAFGPGALLAFLVFGPMIDIKSSLMFLGVFQRRAVAVIVLLVFQMALLAGLFISYTWG